MYVVRAIKVTAGALRETSILARYGSQPVRLSHQCGAADRARQRTSSALACQQGCTEAWNVAGVVASSCCIARSPPAVTIARDSVGMAPALSTSMLTLSDSMVSNVEAAAQSSIGQCSWSVPITGSSWSSWLSSTMHQQHLPPRDGWVPRRCLRELLCASRALQHALSGSVARRDDAVVR